LQGNREKDHRPGKAQRVIELEDAVKQQRGTRSFTKKEEGEGERAGEIGSTSHTVCRRRWQEGEFGNMSSKKKIAPNREERICSITMLGDTA